MQVLIAFVDLNGTEFKLINGNFNFQKIDC